MARALGDRRAAGATVPLGKEPGCGSLWQGPRPAPNAVLPFVLRAREARRQYGCPGSPTQGGCLTSATYCRRRIPFSKGSAPLVPSAPSERRPAVPPVWASPFIQTTFPGCLNALRFVGLPAVESSSPPVNKYHQFRCDGPSRGPLPPVRYRPKQIPSKKRASVESHARCL